MRICSDAARARVSALRQPLMLWSCTPRHRWSRSSCSAYRFWVLKLCKLPVLMLFVNDMQCHCKPGALPNREWYRKQARNCPPPG